MNYKKYVLSVLELVFVAVVAVGVTGIVAFLFYHSMWAMSVLPIVFVFFKKAEQKRRLRIRKERLHKEFIEALKALNNALQAGYSMENAWKEAEIELCVLYGRTSYVYCELVEMNALVKNNMPLEQLMLEFALRTGVDDIIQFAEVFAYGKRSGANWGKIIERTVYRIQEKYETKKEVEVLLAGKRMELLIMCMIPLFLLFFLQMTEREYMAVLYHNLFGAIGMSIALAVYVLAVFLGIKIIQVQV